MRISDWSSDVCSSDLRNAELDALLCIVDREFENALARARHLRRNQHRRARDRFIENRCAIAIADAGQFGERQVEIDAIERRARDVRQRRRGHAWARGGNEEQRKRSEETTSELQSLTRRSYAGFWLEKKTQH